MPGCFRRGGSRFSPKRLRMIRRLQGRPTPRPNGRRAGRRAVQHVRHARTWRDGSDRPATAAAACAGLTKPRKMLQDRNCHPVRARPRRRFARQQVSCRGRPTMSHTASLAWILLAAGSLLTSCTAPPQATAPQAAATAGSPADAVTPLTQPIGFHCPPRERFRRIPSAPW